MEMKMLRWTAGVTRLDYIRHDSIRHKSGVAPIADKMREARLRWYGNVPATKPNAYNGEEEEEEEPAKDTKSCDVLKNTKLVIPHFLTCSESEWTVILATHVKLILTKFKQFEDYYM
ncbi:unnamed protein product [Heligmosomoides polygyrus]|uniref:Uncharacterized protein n=1 Tax=Heligmosomoides polygyrus TaxID=6339 RepID=A0A183GHF0_HELPZ|nr:unnamed protein product [Heligmosomoides polygyrus]